MTIKLHRSIKFPITRHQAAKALNRPYSTITSWTKEPWLCKKDFESLVMLSDAAIRKGTKRKPAVKKKEAGVSYVVLQGGMIIKDKTELYMLIGEGMVTAEDDIYEVSKILRAKSTVTLEEV